MRKYSRLWSRYNTCRCRSCWYWRCMTGVDDSLQPLAMLFISHSFSPVFVDGRRADRRCYSRSAGGVNSRAVFKITAQRVDVCRRRWPQHGMAAHPDSVWRRRLTFCLFLSDCHRPLYHVSNTNCVSPRQLLLICTAADNIALCINTNFHNTHNNSSNLGKDKGGEHWRQPHLRSAQVWHSLSRDHTVLPTANVFIREWNEP